MKKTVNYWVIVHIILTMNWFMFMFIGFINIQAINPTLGSIWGPLAVLSMLFQIAHIVYKS